MKPYSFYFHYNKPASLQQGRPVMSVHWKNTCILVYGVDCSVPTHSRINKTVPSVVMTGYATRCDISPEGIAVLR